MSWLFVTNAAQSIEPIITSVTPGGGKSALPVILAHRLIARGIVDRVLWVVPRDSLRKQAAKAFDDKRWRGLLNHNMRILAKLATTSDQLAALMAMSRHITL